MWTQSLGLGKLVTCRLNPLKPCLPGVAQNFAAVTRTYQLAYCYTVMERNARATLPCVSQHSGQPLCTRLSTFFPFDPYLLSRLVLLLFCNCYGCIKHVKIFYIKLCSLFRKFLFTITKLCMRKKENPCKHSLTKSRTDWF